MKRTILTAALVVAMGTASFASGNDLNGSKAALIQRTKDGKFNLIYADKTPGKVVVKIYDAKGHLLQSDKIENQNGFKLPYDLKGLAAGTYKVLVVDSQGETSLVARIQSLEEMAVNKLSANKFQLVYRDDASKEALVGIYSKAGDLVYSENIRFKDGFSKVYDLSKVTSTGFTFEVSSDGKFRKVSF